MSSSPASSRPHRRPRPRAIPRSTSPATPVTPLTSDNYEWLWCDDHSKITKWFLTKSLSSYEEFYASFINFANTAWETSHRESHAPLKGMEKFVVELLKKERIPADEFIATLERYSAATKKRRRSETKGLIKLHPGLNVHDLTYGKTKLQQKVMAYLRKAENQLRVARLQAAKKATMADQQPLPAFTAPSSLSAPSLGSMLVFDNLTTTLSVPIQIGSLPFVGGKKIIKGDDMDVDE
ncbi:hypothetical protein KCU92_g7780, partial [Aureobasidium melanogenum]